MARSLHRWVGLEATFMRVFAVGLVVAGLVTGGCAKASPDAKSSDTPGAATTATTETAPTSGSSGTENASKPAAATAAAPAWREVVIPAGTTLTLALDTAVASDSSRVEQPVQAHLTQAVMVDGVTAVAQESAVSGVVTSAVRAGKVQGRAHLAIHFDTLAPQGDNSTYPLQTREISRTAASEKKKDAAKIAVPAAGGAVIGGIVGGKKGAVIGGAVGGGAGTAVVMTDRGDEVRLSKGAPLSVKLTEPLTVRVRI